MRRSLDDHALVYVPKVPSFELSDELDNAHDHNVGTLDVIVQRLSSVHQAVANLRAAPALAE